MPDIRIRGQIALLAARLMYERECSEYFTAKRKAARQLGQDLRRYVDLPSNAEIRDQVQLLATIYEGQSRLDSLRDMRLIALRLMRILVVFRPKLIGSVLTGHVRKGSDIDLHVFTDTISALNTALDDAGEPYQVERKRVRKHGEERIYTHIHLAGRFETEITVYAAAEYNYPFKSSITGRLIESATLPQLETLIAAEYPDAAETMDRFPHLAPSLMDRYEQFRMLLVPLEEVKQNPTYHPEGDVLYHALQCYVLARDTAPWDVELHEAALLHDIGKAIDSDDHAGAAAEVLADLVSERTLFLISHHMDAHAIADGTLGHRAKLRLRESEHYEDLLVLADLDKSARVPGAQVPTLDESLAQLRRDNEAIA